MTREIKLPEVSSNGLYVAFEPKPERIAKGAKVSTCNRCGKLVGHWPRDSAGYEIVCLACASDVPAIRSRLDDLAKARGD